jgi:predicted ribosome quality control (RQC) complex YloA/Tae2 family protein
VLVTNITGISPLFAREVIYRASEDAEAPAFDISEKVVFDVFYKMVADVIGKRWQPCVAVVPERAGYAAFAAYQLTHLENVEARESISAAMVDYFGAPVGLEAYSAGKEGVQSQLDDALDRTRRKLAALDREAASAGAIETIRQKGELLYAYAYAIRPKQTEFQAQYEPEGPMVNIELDPALSPAENAKKYFERYEKAKRAIEDLPALQEAARNEIRYLEQIATDLSLAESWPEIDEVRAELQEGSYWRGARTRGPKGGKPGIRRFTEDGFVILVGRNSAQNHALITERSAPGDLWLHARNIPGSHVLIKNDGRLIPESIVQRAAELAAYYSAGRGNTSVEVDITERRYVRPIKGGGPGMVNYKKERTLTVRPHREA